MSAFLDSWPLPHVLLTSVPVVTSPSLTLRLLLSFNKNSVITLMSTWIVQDPPLIFRCWHSALGLFLEFQERGLLFPLGLPGEWDVKLELLRPSCPQRERLPEKEDRTEKHRARGRDCAFQELSGFLDAAELEAVHFRSFYAPAH